MYIRHTWMILIALLFVSSSTPEEYEASFGQLPVEGSIVLNNNYSAEDLVKNVLTKGICENVSNIENIGNNNGIGYFSNGSDIFDMEDGIILSTGYITNALGPNDYIDRSSNFEDNGGDSDLAQLATGAVKDVVGIEFDFVPLDSFIEFTYIFASEEYCEFVGSAFNDVFGFFISGPGINGDFSNNGENVAFVPGTSQYVSVNTINRNHNSDFFISNLNQAGAERCGIPYVNQPNVSRLEYDGFTTPLSAVLHLSPCETYHIKMVIGDVKDHFYDSAVFLKAGSFNLGGQVRVSTDAVVDGEILQEGCDNAYFVFEREDGAASNFPLQVNFTINSASTAEEGVDFSELPSSITIPAGETTASLPVHALNDNETEAPELIILELNIPCACYSDTTMLYIVDAPPFTVKVEDAVVCETSATTIIPMLDGGSPPYSYQWSTGASSPTIDISPNQGNHFAVTVTDDCGQVGTDEFEITARPAPFATLSGNVQICEGEVGYLEAVFTGVPPWELHYSINGVLQSPLTHLEESPFYLPVSQEGQYEITNFYDNDCSGYISGIGIVDVWEIVVDVNATPPDCWDAQNGQIELQVSGDNPPFEINWAHTSSTSFSLSELSSDTYIATITDAQQCSKTIEIELQPPSPLHGVYPDCECIQEGTNCLHAAGGVPPYLYSIDGENFVNESIFDQLTVGEIYSLTIEDANGCRIEQSFQMPYLSNQFFTLSEEEDVKIDEPYTLRPNILLPTDLIDSIIWEPSTFLDCTDCPQPSLAIEHGITYSLSIIDVFGCSQTASIRLNIDPSIDIFIPNVFSPNGDQINDFLTVHANDFQVKEVLIYQIFDRWGGQVFEATNFAPNNPRIGWDGTAREQQSKVGIYTYYLKSRLNDGSTYEIGGDVLLMR